MPIQRIPRYQLLLQELRKVTKKEFPNHADLSLLDDAIDKVVESASHINEGIRKEENLAKAHILDEVIELSI